MSATHGVSPQSATGNQLHVALCFDVGFWAPAFATARSVCLATHRRADLVFHLVHDGLPDAAKADFDRLQTEFGAHLSFFDISADEDYRHFAASLPHTKWISEIAYARLMLARIVDENVDRLVYLDSDILVRASIEELFDADLDGHPLGAVKEPLAWVTSHGREIAEPIDLIDPADPYFNSGVLVIDLKAWRELDLPARLHALQAQAILPRLRNDQLILNYLFKNDWTQIESCWNTISCGKVMEMFDPKLVHYNGTHKPWMLFSYLLPFARIYRHVMTNELFYRYLRYRWKAKWARRLGLGAPSVRAARPPVS